MRLENRQRACWGRWGTFKGSVATFRFYLCYLNYLWNKKKGKRSWSQIIFSHLSVDCWFCLCSSLCPPFPPSLITKTLWLFCLCPSALSFLVFLFSRVVVGVLFFLSQKSSSTLQFTLLAIKTRVSDCLVGEFSASQAPVLPQLSSSPPVIWSVTWQSSQQRRDI